MSVSSEKPPVTSPAAAIRPSLSLSLAQVADGEEEEKKAEVKEGETEAEEEAEQNFLDSDVSPDTRLAMMAADPSSRYFVDYLDSFTVDRHRGSSVTITTTLKMSGSITMGEEEAALAAGSSGLPELKDSPIPGAESTLSLTYADSYTSVTSSVLKDHATQEGLLLKYCVEDRVARAAAATAAASLPVTPRGGSLPSGGRRSLDDSTGSSESRITEEEALRYRNSCLVFTERIFGSKRNFLHTVETLVHRRVEEGMSDSIRRILANMVEDWALRWPEDFELSESFQGKLINIRTMVTRQELQQARFDEMSDGTGRRRSRRLLKSVTSLADETPASAERSSKKKKSGGGGLFSSKKPTEKYGSSPLIRASFSCWNSMTRSWIPISDRKEQESKVSDSSLSRSDLSIVNDKWAKFKKGKKKARKSTPKASKRGRSYTSAFSQSNLESTTIMWRLTWPSWYRNELDAVSARKMGGMGRSTVSCSMAEMMHTHSLTTIAGDMPAMIDGVSKLFDDRELDSHDTRLEQDEFDRMFSWLTLYFEPRFPPNLVTVELNSRGIAESITLLVYELFLQIDPREFENRGWKGMDADVESPFLTRMIRLFNSISKWATMILITEPKLYRRMWKLKRLLRIMESLVDLGNLDSACAIRAGIFDASIADLPMSMLPDKVKSLLDWAYKLDDVRHIKMKDLAKQIFKEGRTFIPVMSAIVDKLHKIEEHWDATGIDSQIHLKWLNGMYKVVSSQVFAVQNLRVDDDGFDRTRDLSEVALPRMPDKWLRYSGITQGRRDLQLLFIRELKQWSIFSKEEISKFAHTAAASVLECGDDSTLPSKMGGISKSMSFTPR